MEDLGKRTILTIAAAFLFVTLGWGFAIQKMADSNHPRVHCTVHLGAVACAPQS